jgi:hypothetical protein
MTCFTVQPCEKGTSGMSEPWMINMQRGETVLTNTAVGTCTMHHDTVKPSLANNPGIVAVSLPASVGMDCGYAAETMFEELTSTLSDYKIVNAHTPDTCCKSCVAEPGCTGATFHPFPSDTLKEIPGEKHEGPGPQPGECFGMHLTNVVGHSSAPGRSVKYVEDMFTEKLAKMDKFDWFMDYNVIFFPSYDQYAVVLFFTY